MLKPGEYIELKKEDFLTGYYDKEDNTPLKIQFLNTPLYGSLVFNKKILREKDEVLIDQITDTNFIKYYRGSKYEYTEEINYKISDNNINNKYSNMATFTINVEAYNNQPPTIGDNDININYNQLYIFNRADFTSNTTPPYNDIENDPAYKLKITKLPGGAFLRLNGINVILNQEILFTDIDNGNLTIEGDSTILTAYDTDFDFEISDTGSQEFSS